MSANAISYLKLLLEDLEKETNQHINYYLKDLEQISNTIGMCVAKPETLTSTTCFQLAEIINLHVFYLRQLNIKRLSTDFKDDALSEIMKTLHVCQIGEIDHANVYQNPQNKEIYKKDQNQNAISINSAIVDKKSEKSHESWIATSSELQKNTSPKRFQDEEYGERIASAKIVLKTDTSARESLAFSKKRTDNGIRIVSNQNKPVKLHSDVFTDTNGENISMSATEVVNRCNTNSLDNGGLHLTTEGTAKILDSEEEDECRALESINMAQVEAESTSNACLAVMGYVPNDEQVICKFYDSRTGSCFKGAHCTKRHEMINPDGWTNDKKYVRYFKLPSMKIPPPETLVYIQVTHIIRPTLFCGLYVQGIFIQSGRFEDAMAFADYMNETEMVDSYKSLDRDPVVGELVIAPFEDDGHYYRARVIQTKECGYVQVLFVDYGNSAEVLITDLREFVPELANVPIQAVTCSLVNVTANITDKMPLMRELVNRMNSLFVDRVLTCKVVGNLGEELHVVAFLDGIDISFYLEQLGFFKREETPLPQKKQFTEPYSIPG